MKKDLETINNEIKSIINESKFISIKLRNKIIKMLGKEFDINLPLENFENIDVVILKNGNIKMRGEEYKRETELALNEVLYRYSNFKEQADAILKKKEINYKNMNDGKNFVNLFITFIYLVIAIAAVIFLIKSFFRGNYFGCVWGAMLLSTYFVPSLRSRIDQSINFIIRKLK